MTRGKIETSLLKLRSRALVEPGLTVNVKDWGDSSESRLESLVKVSEESAVGESDIWHIVLHRP